MNPNHEHSELKELILENQRLLAENNELLKKMRRAAVRHFWLNIVWILFFLGLPFVMYYYFLAPYLESFESLKGMPDFSAILELQGSAWRGIEQR